MQELKANNPLKGDFYDYEIVPPRKAYHQSGFGTYARTDAEYEMAFISPTSFCSFRSYDNGKTWELSEPSDLFFIRLFDSYNKQMQKKGKLTTKDIRKIIPLPVVPSAITQDIQKSRTTSFLIRQIEDYQLNISPQISEIFGGRRICRYEPSCSEYARLAIERRGSAIGVMMAANRLVRCNPFSKGGYDPVT